MFTLKEGIYSQVYLIINSLKTNWLLVHVAKLITDSANLVTSSDMKLIFFKYTHFQENFLKIKCLKNRQISLESLPLKSVCVLHLVVLFEFPYNSEIKAFGLKMMRALAQNGVSCLKRYE